MGLNSPWHFNKTCSFCLNLTMDKSITLMTAQTGWEERLKLSAEISEKAFLLFFSGLHLFGCFFNFEQLDF